MLRPSRTGWGECKSPLAEGGAPSASMVSYAVDLKRVVMRRLVVGIADGVMKVDGKPIYEAKDLRVGLFINGADPAAV